MKISRRKSSDCAIMLSLNDGEKPQFVLTIMEPGTYLEISDQVSLIFEPPSTVICPVLKLTADPSRILSKI